MNKTETLRQIVEMGLSWGRVFLAAVIAQYMAGSTDATILINAGVAAVLPVVLRYLDPNDRVYGRGSNE